MHRFLAPFQTGIPKLYRRVVLALFSLILLFLLVSSAVYTSAVTSAEVTYFTRDNILWNLAAFVLTVLLCLGLKALRPVARWLQRMEADEMLFRRCRRLLLGILGALALIWVLSTQCVPGADQLEVQKAVYGLHMGDYSSFADGGYLSMRHHQLAFTWVSYLFSLVFGSNNNVAFQVFNVTGLLLFYRELSEICRLCGMRRCETLGTLLLGILFYPLILYCSFVYGNIWGLALSVLALRFALLFSQRYKLRHAIFSALAMTGALLFKFNYIIFFIGLLIYLLVEAIQQKTVKLMLLPLLLAAGLVLQSTLPLALTRQVTGLPMDEGASTWAWVAMGLQREGPFFPGWYNNYDVISYEESGHNAAVQAELAKEDIAASVAYFRTHPGEAVRFFAKKILSEWNNPTFQCYWINQHTSETFAPSGWVSWFSQGEGSDLGAQFLNLLQFVILAGALLYCILHWRDADKDAFLVLAMILIGGFLFHIVWEAKPQYTLSFFVLLLPYAAAGYGRLSGILLRLWRAKGASAE